MLWIDVVALLSSVESLTASEEPEELQLWNHLEQVFGGRKLPPIKNLPMHGPQDAGTYFS